VKAHDKLPPSSYQKWLTIPNYGNLLPNSILVTKNLPSGIVYFIVPY
jgi:hypothetical protein